MTDQVAVLPALEPLSMGAVLRIPTLRRLWYAQIVSVFGDFVALFAVITVMTFKLHALPQQVVGVQIAYLLPIAVLGIISGVFVDRWPLKPTMVASDLIRAGLVLLLLVVHTVWGFYLVLAAISIVSSFFGPAQGVIIRSVVPRHGLRSANALMQQVMFIMRIIGPTATPFLVTWLGAKSCYVIDSASFLVSGLTIASLALGSRSISADEPSALDPLTHQKTGLARVWDDMKGGVSFIVHHSALLFVILALGAGMFVMGCFGPLIAIYVRDILHASTRTFGAASATISGALLVGINVLNFSAKKVKNTVLVYCGLTGIGIGAVLLAALPFVSFTILGCFTIGFSAAGIIVPTQTLIQQETPAALMGRVGSTVLSTIFSAQITGLVLSGILTKFVTLRSVFGLCAGMLAVLVVAGKVWMEPKEQQVVSSQ